MAFDVAASSYDRFMGVYSSQLAPQLADLAEIDGNVRVVDVGCGPGALTAELVRRVGADAVSAVDPSESFVAAARDRHPGVDVHVATAEQLPFEDDSFDAALAQLVVHFMTSPVGGLREMARVTVEGGAVAACVWDHAGARSPIATYWEAARELAPTVHDESDLAGARAGHLRELLEAAGLTSVQETELRASVRYTSFDQWWEPFTLGVGPAGAHVQTLDEPTQARVQARCAELLPDPPFELHTIAWAARGDRPASMTGIDEGLRGLADADWQAAHDVFLSALSAEPDDPDALDGLGRSLWWLGQREDAIERRRQAYVAYQRLDDRLNAGRVATYLAGEERIDGRTASAAGWLARARRLLAEFGTVSEQGWLEIEEAKSSGDVTSAETHGRAALAIAHELGDHDVECMALAQIGRALIAQGRHAEGVRLLDEAMTIALGGESSDPFACGDACCTTLVACESLADLRRSAEWCEAVVEFTERRRFTPVQSWCRSIYASVLIRAGDWDRAETVLDETLRRKPSQKEGAGRALPLGTLAELRLRQGRTAEAAALLDGLDDGAVAQRVRLAIQSGDLDRAGALLERGRAELSAPDGLILDAELALTVGDVAAAGSAAAELARLGSALDRDDLRAAAAYVGACAAGAHGDPDEVVRQLDAAVNGYADLGYPLEEGRARLERSRALARTGSSLALDEARRARDGFETLGARADADAAASFLRELGVSGRSTQRVDRDSLTARETEVLRLVADGLSNAEIARRLVISPKTAEHHVGRVLAKLGVRSRAEAAAHAVREGL